MNIKEPSIEDLERDLEANKALMQDAKSSYHALRRYMKKEYKKLSDLAEIRFTLLSQLKDQTNPE